ncbi:MAG: CinA family protein [Actinomycetales bacterium]|nr:CinA family protein [Actinomycetales bacterium]
MPDVAADVLAELEARGLKLALAESLTGGLLADAFISVPGASKVVLGSIVAYHSLLKSSLVGVSRTLIENEGAVNAEVAAQLAQGIRVRLADGCGLDGERVLGISATGVAGPDSQDGQMPGVVFIGLAGTKNAVDDIRVVAVNLEGSRDEIRRAAVSEAIRALAEFLAD